MRPTEALVILQRFLVIPKVASASNITHNETGTLTKRMFSILQNSCHLHSRFTDNVMKSKSSILFFLMLYVKFCLILKFNFKNTV